MSLIAALVTLLLLGSSAVAAASAQQREPGRESGESGALLRKVIERYEAAPTCRLDFTQESYWALADTVARTTGVLFVKRPRHVSIRYGDSGRLVTNGESLKVYVPETGQFFVSAIDSSDVVLDPAQLLRRYSVDPGIPELVDEGGGMVSVNLVPNRPPAEPAALRVVIDVDNRSVSRIEAFTSSGDSTVYIVERTDFGLVVPEEEFTLTKPANAQLIVGSSSWEQ
jgi:outer membrane lipoprotein-sorting protein